MTAMYSAAQMGEDRQRMPVCPFYIEEGKDCIVCEGMAAGSRSVQLFRSAAGKEAWMRDVCSDMRCARLCPITCIQNYLYDDQAPGAEPCIRRYTRLEIKIRRGLIHRRRQKPCGM